MSLKDYRECLLISSKLLLKCKNCNDTYPVTPAERFSWMFLNNQYEILDHPIINNPETHEWEDASGKYTDKLKKTRKNRNARI